MLMFIPNLVNSLFDPVFLIGGGSIVFGTLILTMVMRSPELHFTPRQRQRATYIVLAVGLCALVVVGGYVEGVRATTSSSVQKTSSAPTTLPLDLTTEASPTAFASPYTTPTPMPTLTASAINVLNTLCGAINRYDTAAILQQYAPSLRHTVLTNRARLAKQKGVQLRFIHCRVADTVEQLPIVILMMQTEDGNGYADGYERPYQFLMERVQGVWKVASIKYCLSDGCIDITGRISQ
jgi:hypothetical protein